MSIVDHRGAEAQVVPDHLDIAVDTEFDNACTLTVQAAARLGADTLAVQLYRSAALPELPADFDLGRYLPSDQYGRFFKHLLLRPLKPLTPELSPARVAQDLLGLEGWQTLSPEEGRRRLARFDPLLGPGRSYPANVAWDERARRWRIPLLRLALIGHHFKSDFGRLFGREFLAGLRAANAAGARLGVEGRKLLRFVAKGGRQRAAPVLEYLFAGGHFLALRLAAFDTLLPFGPASLDRHARTFLGVGKSAALGEADKQDMPRAFRERPEDAYGYAAADAVITLLVHEQMCQKDRELYQAFGIGPAEAPPLRPFVGGRVSTFLLRTTAAGVAGGSELLASEARLRRLMGKGGVGLFEDQPDVSKFGDQAGQVHGGLLLNRSPDRLWHEAKGMLADIDLCGCYGEICGRLHVYWGRPLILEPGGSRMTLAEAVALARGLADDDGWLVWASGPIEGFKNLLIPSTDGALTGANYVARQGRRRRRAARQDPEWGAGGDPDAAQGARPYAARVDFGAVAYPTWLMVQALPPEVRRQYERLSAECVVLYPRALAARSGREYDELVARRAIAGPPWEGALDPDTLELVQRQKVGADHVTLKYPLGHFARQLGSLRREAQARDGKGSGLDLALKLHSNALYGVLGSRFHPVNNFLAANVVTATARALAWAMSQSLNAIQTITDGCTYRRDQVPACSYAECLHRKPDFPLCRAEAGDGVPFLGPSEVPTDRAALTAWYREHVRRFFNLSRAEYDALFATHELEHKAVERTGAAAFDGLACDGCNYVKATVDDAGAWRAEEMKARSYGRRSKEALQDWLLRAYRTDTLAELPPLAEDVELLSLCRAAQRARAALAAGLEEVYLPLGLALTRVLGYKVVKMSGLVFESAAQRSAVLKQVGRFEQRNGCGLEVLALRRGYRDRRQGSLQDLLRVIHEAVRAGEHNLAPLLNLNKLPVQAAEAAAARRKEVAVRKAAAERRLAEEIDPSNLPAEARPTALLVTAEEVAGLRRRGDVLELRPHKPPPVLGPGWPFPTY